VGKPEPTYQKLRGGYYTPQPIADFLAQWAIQSQQARILEPSCGDGIFLETAINALVDCGSSLDEAIDQVQGVELDRDEAQKSIGRIANAATNGTKPQIHVGDFFAFCKEHLTNQHLFDVVIGNPPFIRYQNFPEGHRSTAFQLMRDAGMHPNRLTNSWVPFLVATTLLLDQRGRMAMVIPAELMQVSYAAELREFLSENYSYITLVTFRKLVFEDIQQEIVLLLGERNGTTHSGIRTVELDDLSELTSYSHTLSPNFRFKKMDHSTEKWTMYFLNERELSLIRDLRGNKRLTLSGEVLDVDVGIVTGNNQFFILKEEEVKASRLEEFVIPIIGRSAHMPGATLTSLDWKTLVSKQLPVFLLNIPPTPTDDLPNQLREYLAAGEERKVHTGFKCRTRTPWYTVPSIWTPDAFMLRQIHQHPKIVLNTTDATSTDTVHRVRFRKTSPSKTAISAAFYNSLTFAFSEIVGRSYGGGVLELQPSEAEKLPLPLRNAETIDIYKLDGFIRAGETLKALDYVDGIVLRQGLGLTKGRIKQLRDVWEKLRDRRMNRR
jgi:adenine-specific DNA-methyltransferase